MQRAVATSQMVIQCTLSAGALHGDKLYIVSPAEHTSDDMRIYDFDKQEWTMLHLPSKPPASMNVLLGVHGNQLIQFGGRNQLLLKCNFGVGLASCTLLICCSLMSQTIAGSKTHQLTLYINTALHQLSCSCLQHLSASISVSVAFVMTQEKLCGGESG